MQPMRGRQIVALSAITIVYVVNAFMSIKQDGIADHVKGAIPSIWEAGRYV